MRHVCLFGIFAFLAHLQAHAQFTRREDQKLIHKVTANCPRVYLGFSTGINNPVGPFGLQAELTLSERLSIGSGIGFSSWGLKTFLESRYYFKPCNRGWAIAGGVTYSIGDGLIGTGDEETVNGNAQVRIDLNDQVNFMASAYYFFDLGRQRRNRFHLQFGYSLPLSASRFTQVEGPPLTDRGRDNIHSQHLQTITPGGPILGLGFSFGAGSR